MEIPFWKYQGTGNDFIILDGMKGKFRLSQEKISFLCDRRFGIGADGLMQISSHTSLDFEMTYYNADGRLGSMCGNGGRCLVMFAHRMGYIGHSCSFLASDGEHFAQILGEENWVSLQMSDVRLIKKIGKDDYFTDTGSPHFVRWTDDLLIDVVKTGREIRYHENFAPGGTNVNFIRWKDGNLFVRTYERGVEDETLSCGTGVTASALVAAETGLPEALGNICPVETPGGFLRVKFQKKDEGYGDIRLEGPATFVFEGRINI